MLYHYYARDAGSKCACMHVVWLPRAHTTTTLHMYACMYQLKHMQQITCTGMSTGYAKHQVLK
jgi:hypothetical protein